MTRSKPTAEIEVDLALLEEARTVLVSSEFSVRSDFLTAERLPWLLAENELFALGVAAARTLDDLVALDVHATEAIADRIRNAGAKRWDGYLVLIASEDGTDIGSETARSLTYNTALLRRVVSLGVPTGLDGVRQALRSFLPLPPPSTATVGSAFVDLADELVLQGIDRGLVEEAIQDYQVFESAA